MGVRQWILNGIRRIMLLPHPSAGVLTEEIREKGLEVRRMQSRMRHLEKQLEMKKKMDIMEKAIGAGSGADIEKMFMMGIMGKLFGNIGNTEQQNLNTSKSKHFTNEEIKTFIQANPKHAKALAKLDETQVYNALKKLEPKADEDSLKRAVIMIKNGE